MDDTCAAGELLVWSPPKSLQFTVGIPGQQPSTGCRNLMGRRTFGEVSASLRAARPLVTLGLLLGLLSLSAGCVPLKYTISPGATGRIVDAATRAPVSGAEVVISRSTYPPESPDKAFDNSRSPTVMSNDQGTFSLPVERRVDLYCVPVDVFPRFGLLVVKCKGYATTCLPFWSHSVADLGDIPVPTAVDATGHGATPKQ